MMDFLGDFLGDLFFLPKGNLTISLDFLGDFLLGDFLLGDFLGKRIRSGGTLGNRIRSGGTRGGDTCGEA